MSSQPRGQVSRTLAGWMFHKQPNQIPSLPEAHRTITMPRRGFWARLLAVVGPGFLISVGYMDPGNWATDLAGGSRFGYTLLWVVLLSNIMAIVLQTLSVRLGLATGKDLAQCCRDSYKFPVVAALWLLCEVAIIACDLAEVIGSAVALNLLFGLKLVWGVLLTGADVLLLLGLMRFGFRKIEAIVATLVVTVAGCFVFETIKSSPVWGLVASGLFTPVIPTRDALYITVGIIGATVMPHNLYLHSSIVQTRAYEESPEGRRAAIRFNTWDTVGSLSLAFFVNAAILVLAAAVFHQQHQPVEELQQAYNLLTPLLGGMSATVFAVALLASGQSSTITGTLAGQIVMEGFLRIRIKPWIRRILTRGIALIPALVVVTATGGSKTLQLLLLSQVVLAMQLSFATFPLVMFTSDPVKMGEFASPRWLKYTGYAIAYVIGALNLYLLAQTINLIWLTIAIVITVLFVLWVRRYPDPAAAPPANPLIIN